MKRFLLMGAALITVAGINNPAMAQSGERVYSKGDARIFDDARMMSDDDTTAVTRTTRTETYETNVADIEPAAGTYRDGEFADFTGIYAGGNIGYSLGSYDVNDPAGPDGDVGVDGMNGGVFVGYGFEHNFDLLGAYAGIEAGYEWSGADGELGGTSYEKDSAWLVTFRPGISVMQDALGYGIIGYSRAEFESGGDSEDLDGLVLGAGAQFDTGTPFKTRLEYTYTNYEDADLNGVSFDGHENNIKLGAVFQF